MELIFQTTNHQEATTICALLEQNGIPAFKTNENVNRLGRMGLGGIGVFIHLNEQKSEALRLLGDPLYVVENKVDLENFYQQAEKTDTEGINNYIIVVLLKSLGVLLLVSLIGFLIVSKI